MNKHLFPLVMIAAAVITTTTSCNSSDDVPPPVEEFAGLMPAPTYSELAATFELVKDKITDNSTKASLTSISITESGKAIIEVTTASRVKYVTYEARIDGNTYTITDSNGKEVGKLQKAQNRSSQEVSLTLNLSVTIEGQTLTFTTTDPVTAQMMVNTVTASGGQTSVRTTNLARTWTVAQMNIVLEGDIDLSKLVQGGNLKEFADAAQEAGAGLTQEEMDALDRTINSITLDKNGTIAIEYADGITEAASWQWADAQQEAILLTLRSYTDFGNKYLTAGGQVDVNITENSVVLTLHTNISGSMQYQAILSIVLK